VLLPSEPEEYGTEAELLFEIQDFIHRYVGVSVLFEKIASYYILFSWVLRQLQRIALSPPPRRSRQR